MGMWVKEGGDNSAGKSVSASERNCPMEKRRE